MHGSAGHTPGHQADTSPAARPRAAAAWPLMAWHRLIALATLPLLLYVVVTGLGIEAADIVALTRHAPATAPDMLMMRQHIYGPPNYAVVSAPDYAAPALPKTLDMAAALARTVALGRQAAPGATLRLAELRWADNRVAGHVQMDGQHMLFDLASGRRLSDSLLPPPEPPRGFPSTRSNFKFFHRFNYLGQMATALDGIAGIAFALMMLTGLRHYFRLLKARRRVDRDKAPLARAFWRSREGWRDAHRAISLAAALPIAWMALSGLALSIDNVTPALRQLLSAAPPKPATPAPFDGDFSAPLADAQLPAMLATTLAAYRQDHPDQGIKVLRLRHFSGYDQGVIVAADDASTQLVYNARTGAVMSMHEPGYPVLGFPSGWEWHQRLKRIHRGDIFGLGGRWLSLLGGLAMAFLAGSGIVMYARQWRRRAARGDRALFWRP